MNYISFTIDLLHRLWFSLPVLPLLIISLNTLNSPLLVLTDSLKKKTVVKYFFFFFSIYTIAEAVKCLSGISMLINGSLAGTAKCVLLRSSTAFHTLPQSTYMKSLFTSLPSKQVALYLITPVTWSFAKMLISAAEGILLAWFRKKQTRRAL